MALYEEICNIILLYYLLNHRELQVHTSRHSMQLLQELQDEQPLSSIYEVFANRDQNLEKLHGS